MGPDKAIKCEATRHTRRKRSSFSSQPHATYKETASRQKAVTLPLLKPVAEEEDVTSP